MTSDNKKIKIGLGIFFGLCVILLALDFVFPPHDVHFAWEHWPDFYCVYGLVACIFLVLIAKYILRPLVIRDEDYYE